MKMIQDDGGLIRIDLYIHSERAENRWTLARSQESLASRVSDRASLSVSRSAMRASRIMIIITNMFDDEKNKMLPAFRSPTCRRHLLSHRADNRAIGRASRQRRAAAPQRLSKLSSRTLCSLEKRASRAARAVAENSSPKAVFSLPCDGVLRDATIMK